MTESRQEIRYHLRHLERFELGTPYPKVITRTGDLLNSRAIRKRATLVADATGVGRPVIDMFDQAGLTPVAVTITGGDTVNRHGSNYRVPKRDLVSTLQVLLQSGRLKIAKQLPEAKTLVDELLNFKVKITVNANDTYGTWREGVHDDLVLAVALACWYGELNKFDFVDDLFLEEKEQTPGPYFIDSHMMNPEGSWVIADYLKKEKERR